LDQSNQITNLTNFHLEFNLQQKMMLILLNLASDPTVSLNVQKRRRELYEKTKLNMAKLQNHLQNQKQFQSKSHHQQYLIDNNNFINSNGGSISLHKLSSSSHGDRLNESKSFSSSSTTSTSSSSANNLLSHTNNFITDQLEISPASIHRKDSYRRAQEQKLFLESNSNYLNKQNNKIALTGRKVRTIPNNPLILNPNSNDLQLLSNPFDSNRSNRTNISIDTNTNNNTSTTNSNNSESKRAYLINHNENINTNGRNSHNKNPKIFYLDDQQQQQQQQLMNNTTDSNENEQLLNGSTNTNLNGFCGSNTNAGVGVGLSKKCSQRKNTSDSNVKLLADHNFYHVTHRRHHHHHNHNNYHINDSFKNNQNNDFIFKEINENNFKQNEHFLEQFKYNNSSAKFNNNKRSGLNSSSNSLISLNSSSIGTNEDSNNINSSDRDLIKSNPDLKSSLVYSPKSINFNNEHYLLTQNGSNPNNRSNNISINTSNLSEPASNGTINSNNSSNFYHRTKTPTHHHHTPADMSNLSNNLSLNLSIHTAEEFGVEMLAWLNNNEGNMIANGNGGHNLHSYLMNNNDENKMANNATLV
jgi:hypothetical protein